VLFCQGSSARQATGMKSLPVDAVVIGIVDTVDVLNKKIYPPASRFDLPLKDDNGP
jgi:ethanolamine utilization protein EutN